MFNVEFLLPAFLLALFGGFNFNFSEFREDSKAYFGNWFVYSLVLFVVTDFIFWLTAPAIVSPYLNLFWFVTVYWLVGLIIAGKRLDDLPVTGAIAYIFFLVIFVVMGVVGSNMFNARSYHDLIGEVTEGNWTEDMAPVDEAHIRVVNKGQAQYLADKVLGESKNILGSRYSVGEVNISNVNGEIFWIAPLEFRGFWKWNRFNSTSGYVMVSAEDNNRKPILVDTLEMKYLTSSFWSKNLVRHVYINGYSNYNLHEITFELDDNYRPFYVISATRPSIVFGGQKTEGAIIVDPQTGTIVWQALGETDSWIDRVVPETLAEDYMKWWGKYIRGWWNAQFVQEDVTIPTPYAYGHDVWFVPDDLGNNYWYTGMTSISNDDQALVSIMLMNTQTGETKKYRLSGSNEDAITQAVTQALGADAQNWVATQPMPYNIYGELSFVVPVVGISKPILQKIAIVRASNLNTALGNDKRSALRKYQRILSSNGNIVAPTHSSDMKQAEGVITRKGWEIQDDNFTFYILLDSYPNKLFSVNSSANPEILISKELDKVSLTFIETKEAIVPVISFDVLGIDLKESAAQTKYEQMFKKSEEKVRKLEGEKKIDNALENLSPEEKRKMFEAYKEKK